MRRFALIALLLLALPGAASAQALSPLLTKFMEQVPAGEMLAGADGYGAITEDIPVAPIMKDGEIAGYAYITSDFCGTTGYSGKPIHVMVAVDPEGILLAAHLVDHSESIVLIGIPSSKIQALPQSYAGIDLVAEAAAGGEAHELNIVSGATVTIMVIDDSIIRSGILVARALGLGGLTQLGADAGPTREIDPDVSADRDWATMTGDGAVRRLTLDVGQINAAYEASGDERAIARLENIFSLYQAGSALSQLNATGHLDQPPFELIELLSLCRSIHHRTNGAFDPTVQPLWALYAARHAAGTAPGNHEITQALTQTGRHRLSYTPARIAFTGHGMALTLNGIAQGYIADKVATLLRRNGVTDTLVNMGEIDAMGRRPGDRPWQIGIADPDDPATARATKRLHNQAIATSAPQGTVFDQNGTAGHILDPRNGAPGGKWREVSVIADQAALADGLSTAFCLMTRDQIDQVAKGVQVDLLPLG